MEFYKERKVRLDQRTWAFQVVFYAFSSHIRHWTYRWVPAVVLSPVGLHISPAAKRFWLVQHCCHLLNTEVAGSLPILAPPLMCACQAGLWLIAVVTGSHLNVGAPIFVSISAHFGANNLRSCTCSWSNL